MCHSGIFSYKQKKCTLANVSQKEVIGRVPGSSWVDGMIKGQGLRREAQCPEDAATGPVWDTGFCHHGHESRF